MNSGNGDESVRLANGQDVNFSGWGIHCRLPRRNRHARRRGADLERPHSTSATTTDRHPTTPTTTTANWELV